MKEKGDSPVSSYLPTPQQIVKLNIGGHKFITTVGTLTSTGPNFFTALLDSRTPAVKDEDGYFFVDRDGQFFGPLLSFLRCGELNIPSGQQRAVEREAHFFLIDFAAALRQPAILNPLSTTPAGSLHGVIPHNKLREDGLYMQRERGGTRFIGYYRFAREEHSVRYVSIASPASNRSIYAKAGDYTELEYPWVFLRSGSKSTPTKLMCSVQPYGLEVHWRYPSRQEKASKKLRYWSSRPPLVGVLFSDEKSRKSLKVPRYRIFFKDQSTATVTVLAPSHRQSGGSSTQWEEAEYILEWQEGLCLVHVTHPLFNLSLLSLGPLLVEAGDGGRKASLGSKGNGWLRVFTVRDTEPDAVRPDTEEIDIYEFLRTCSPGQEEASAESSEEGDRDYKSL